MLKILLGTFLLALFSVNSLASEFILPSGEPLKIFSLSKAYLLKDNPALILEYETNTDLDDITMLRKNAETIWPVFINNVHNEKMVNAVIKASTPQHKTSPITYTTKSYSFVVTQKENETWQFINWGRNYESEAEVKAVNFIKSIIEANTTLFAKTLHFPSSFDNEEISNEIEGIQKFISAILTKTGAILSYKIQQKPIRYKHLFFQTASKSIGKISLSLWV